MKGTSPRSANTELSLQITNPRHTSCLTPDNLALEFLNEGRNAPPPSHHCLGKIRNIRLVPWEDASRDSWRFNGVLRRICVHFFTVFLGRRNGSKPSCYCIQAKMRPLLGGPQEAKLPIERLPLAGSSLVYRNGGQIKSHFQYIWHWGRNHRHMFHERYRHAALRVTPFTISSQAHNL